MRVWVWAATLLALSCGSPTYRRTYDVKHSPLTKEDFPSREEAVLLLERDSEMFKRMTFDFEKSYDGVPLLLWSRTHYWLAPVASILYVIMISAGPRWMAKREAFDLKMPLRYWNLLLAIFSGWGASRVIPHTVSFVYKFGWTSALCSPPVFTYGRGAVGLWTGLFVYSKYVELIDTVFIILRKRNLNFLHWYHHATVLMYTWDAFVTEQPPGLFYSGMNYGVHTVMYFYYYLSGVLPKPPRWGIFVTILQIAQMIAGVGITAVSLRNAFTKPFMFHSTREMAEDAGSTGMCYVSRTNMLAAAAMYSTYFYLFADFFYKRYIMKREDKAKKI